MRKWDETKTTCLRFVHIFACVTFEEIYYLRARIHFIFHYLLALPPYSECLIAEQVTYWNVEQLQPSLFSITDRERKKQMLRFGSWFPWLYDLGYCATCKLYATPLCKIVNCFSVCICVGIRPLLSRAGEKQAWIVCWSLDFEFTR